MTRREKNEDINKILVLLFFSSFRICSGSSSSGRVNKPIFVTCRESFYRFL